MKHWLRILRAIHRVFLLAARDNLFDLRPVHRLLSHDLALSCAHRHRCIHRSAAYATPLRFQLGEFFDRILPLRCQPILQSYFVEAPHNARPSRVVLVAAIVSITGASSVIAKLMEGLRRANNLPRNCWSVWSRLARAYLLVPLSLLPFAITSSLVVFGHIIVAWLALNVMSEARASVYFIAVLLPRIVHSPAASASLHSSFTWALPCSSPGSAHFPEPSQQPPCGSSPLSPSDGMSHASPTTPGSTALSAPGLRCFSGSTSSRSASSSALNLMPWSTARHPRTPKLPRLPICHPPKLNLR